MKAACRPGGAHGEKREPLDKQVQQVLEEARTVLPGIQALFGFQLIVVFHPTFGSLDRLVKGVHLAALLGLALAMALIMTPAAYHRLVERGKVSEHFATLASRFVAAAMPPLMLAIVLDVLLVASMVLGSLAWSLAIAGAVLAVFGWLWLAWPLRDRRRRPHSEA